MSGENWRNMKIPFRIRSKMIDLATLCADDIDENDIAFTLARTFRFNGATDQLYSVAQHSVMCASVAPEEHKLAALLHDAHEYILGDIAGLVQTHVTENNHRFSDVIGELKSDIDFLIEDHFCCPGVLTCDNLKKIDKRMLATEMIYLFGENYTEYEPYIGLNETWSPEKSEKLFLETLKGLMDARKNISK